MVFFVGIAAAICLGLGYVLQQRVAARSQETTGRAFRLLLELMHQRAWWAGIGVMIIGQLLGGLALGLASVSLVEPLLSSSLLFAFFIAAFLSKQRVRWHEILGACWSVPRLAYFSPSAIRSRRTTQRPTGRWSCSRSRSSPESSPRS